MRDEHTPIPTQATAEDPVSPWVTYLIGKKVSAELFLRDMADGVVSAIDDKTRKPKKRKTFRIPQVDNKVRSQFAEALAGEPERVDRLISMLQAAMSASESIRHRVVDLAEAGLMRLGLVAIPDSPDAVAFGEAISTWMRNIPNRPLKPADLNTLLLLLHVGWYRQLLDHDAALGLLASAFSRQTGTSPGVPGAKLAPRPIDALLAAETSGTTLPTLAALFQAAKAATDKADARTQTQLEQIERLSTENAELRAAIDRLRAEKAALEEGKGAAEAAIAELERQNLSTRASYQHKLDDVRGRIDGVLEGQLSRWLRTSLEAVRATPPRVEVIEERLEDTLALIERELKWLRPSA